MKNMKTLLIFFLCFSITLLNAQVKPLVGREKLVKEIALPSFETIVSNGGGNLFFHYSLKSKIEIKGAGPCVEGMQVSVASGTLNIRPKAGFSENCRAEIHVFTPSIKGIQQNGGGRVVIKEGFAPMDIFNCSMDGGGAIQMIALSVDSLFASIEGGGVISAQVRKHLDGKISGGGVILYQGDPVVESKISGGGVIKRK